MNERWKLDALYPAPDAPAIAEDMAALQRECAAMRAFAEREPGEDRARYAREYFALLEGITALAEKLGVYASLRQAADTGDGDAMTLLEQVSAALSTIAGATAAVERTIAASPPAQERIAADDALRPYEYLLRRIRSDARYLLPPREEELLARMTMSGSDAWEQLHDTITAGLSVPYRGGTETLSSIRNLASSPDPAVRREAYEAELAAYARIEDAGAFALNSIKLETVTQCSLRGFDSALDRSLVQAHMKRETLDALFAAMEEYMPVFRRYLRAKGRALGHDNGLPWYDLFAPMGKPGRTYTPEQARETLLEVFTPFDDEVAGVIRRAFDEEWIDFYPRRGKVGGAFCCMVYGARQSRVLTNFSGQFSDLVTLAHELGHAFHNEMLFDHPIICKDEPMPLAETASTFNENVLVSEILRHTRDPQERLALIENQLADACQILCDIDSRFRFEKGVIEDRASGFMPAAELCRRMLQAQEESYGDGLDPTVRHPYMWLCKGHYYSGSLSYYNFPYAFGGLFARGLYAMYREEGAAFVPKYKQMLRATTVMDAEEAAALCGADLTDRAFWTRGLESYREEIDEFISLL